MTRVFADTYHFIALLSPRDGAHAEAVRLSQAQEGHLVTTDAVLLELADAMASPRDRQTAAAFVASLWRRPGVRVRCIDRDLMKRALALFASRHDKDWGLTDCISFVVMREEGIEQALTGDSHFTQAGFTILFSG